MVSILREGYALHFKMKLPLTRSPLIMSVYADLVKNRYLKEAVHALTDKFVVEKVVISVWSSLAFYNRLFLVLKPNDKWRPILDLSYLNLYLNPKTFKMQMPETKQWSGQRPWISAKRTSPSIKGQ